MTTDIHAYDASNLEPTRENKKIYQSVLMHIERLRPSSVLEVGSGIGMLGNEIQKKGMRYVGLEPDRAQLVLCRQRYPSLEVVEGSCYEAPEKYDLGQFDLVFSTDVIEHLFLPRRLVGFKKYHVGKSGYVLTCTPEFGSYGKNILYSLFGKWDMVHSPLWDGGHIKFFSRRWMKKIFEEQGFCGFQWATVRNVNIPILPMSMICICQAA
jgi:2-polyprenyl-3-methyl-5-hydroxy-6-metoxy-1,4-benzoquinol methylase